MKPGFYSAFALLITMGTASAHLLAGSLMPKEGTFVVGATMSIEWIASQAHDGKYDIYLSKDGGVTFTEIVGPYQGSLKDGGKNAYPWKVTSAYVSTKFRIRVCQLFGGHCVQPNVYMMDSPTNMIIANVSGISQNNNTGMLDPQMQFLADNKNLTVAFTLSQERNISLKAFDVDGKLVATVANGKKGAGEYRFPVLSNATNFKGPLVFKLEAGEEVFTQIWSGW